MGQAQTRRPRRWEELDITDDFTFTRVMRNKRLCRTLLFSLFCYRGSWGRKRLRRGLGVQARTEPCQWKQCGNY